MNWYRSKGVLSPGLGPFFIDWQGAVPRLQEWVDGCFDISSKSEVRGTNYNPLAMLLAPKTGKTHALYRVLEPMIREKFRGRALIVSQDMTGSWATSFGDDPAAAEATLDQNLILFAGKIASSAQQQGFLVPDAQTNIPGWTSLERVFSNISRLGISTFLLLDEIGRLVQAPERQAQKTLNYFKSLVGLPNVYIAFAGSGMVNFLAQVSQMAANGFSLFQVIQKLDLGANVTPEVSRFVAKKLLDHYRVLDLSPEELYSLGCWCTSFEGVPHPALLHYFLRIYIGSKGDNRELDTVIHVHKKFQTDFDSDCLPFLKHLEKSRGGKELLKLLRRMTDGCFEGAIEPNAKNLVPFLEKIGILDANSQGKMVLRGFYPTVVRRWVSDDGSLLECAYETQFDSFFKVVSRLGYMNGTFENLAKENVGLLKEVDTALKSLYLCYGSDNDLELETKTGFQKWKDFASTFKNCQIPKDWPFPPFSDSLYVAASRQWRHVLFHAPNQNEQQRLAYRFPQRLVKDILETCENAGLPPAR